MVRAHEAGGVLVPTGRAKGPPPPKTDPAVPRRVAEVHGVLLTAARGAVPVSSVLTGFAYLRRLATHRRRVLKELARRDRATVTAMAHDGTPPPKRRPKPVMPKCEAGRMSETKLRRKLLIGCAHQYRSKAFGWTVIAAYYAEHITAERAAELLDVSAVDFAKLVSLADAELKPLAPAKEGVA